MTVAELRELLAKYPDDMEVVRRNSMHAKDYEPIVKPGVKPGERVVVIY